MVDERPILTLGDADLDDLTYLRLRATQRAEQHIRIVRDTSQLLEEVCTTLLQFGDPYKPPASDPQWNIEGAMEVPVDQLLAIWAEEIHDRACEEHIWTYLS